MKILVSNLYEYTVRPPHLWIPTESATLVESADVEPMDQKAD